MMKQTQIIQTLINQWKEQYQQLHDFLEAEQSALEKRDFTELEVLSEKKNVLVEQINQQQIPAIISQGNISNPNIHQVKKFCLDSSQLKPCWNELMSLVKQCNFKNEVNARLIDLVATSTKRTVNLIKGFDPDNNIYNAKGGRTMVKHYGQSLSA